MYELTKIASFFLSPLTLLFIFLTSACILIYLKKMKAGIMIFISTFIFLWFLSSNFGQDFLAKPLENSIISVNPLDYPNIKKIIVMGNGTAFPSNRPPNAKLSNIAVMRLVEGVRIYNLIQADTIFFTGRNFADKSTSIAELMKQTAIGLGVGEENIITIDHSRNTRDEAKYLSEYLKGDSVFLVSSAAHLKRAKINFENAGFYVLQMPTDYQISVRDKITISYFLPNPFSLANSEKSLHEYRGLLWEKVKSIFSSQSHKSMQTT